MDDITLSSAEAQGLYEALSTAHNYLWVLDLSESYRKLNRQNRSSPLTLEVERYSKLIAERLGLEDVSAE
jgi:hypothetical protein